MGNKRTIDSSPPRKQELIDIIKENEDVYKMLKLVVKLNLPNWYVGAGCITQSVWNTLHDFPISQNILDIDLIFFDAEKMDDVYEENLRREISEETDISLKIDVVNEARVHLWYEHHFGIKIPPYTSSEEAISTWPSTATSVGVKLEGEEFKVYAPFGLEDLFNLIVRPNKKMIPREVFEKKASRWKSHWPKLKIVDWDA